MTMELNNLQEKADYIEIKSLMIKVWWKKTTGMDTVSFKKKQDWDVYKYHYIFFSQNLLNIPHITYKDNWLITTLWRNINGMDTWWWLYWFYMK